MVNETAGPVAAIDCGTNSTRLLVVSGRGTVLERKMRITRLGEGVDATRKLSRQAVARTVSVLGDYRRLMDHHGVVAARLVATSAARDATNAEEFLALAHDVTGVRPEVLSGLEEGALSFAGATAHVPPERVGPGPVLVVDIGGGSTELVVGQLHRAATPSTDLSSVSLDLGCVRVAERFLLHDPPQADELAEARRVVDFELDARAAYCRRWPRGDCSSGWPARCRPWPRWTGAWRLTSGPPSTTPCSLVATWRSGAGRSPPRTAMPAWPAPAWSKAEPM